MSSSQKAQWGILGTAKIARERLIPGIRDSESSQVGAVASRSEERAREFAGKFGIPKSYGSYEGLLKDDRLEFVYIPLPNHLHPEWSIRAAEAGKHVLCEKPLGARAEEVEKAFKVAEDQGVKLMEGFMYRFHPQVRRVKELLEKGEIGEPVFFRGAHSFPLVTENRDQDIRWKEELGGGSLMDVGTYSVNTVRYLFDQEPERVFARNSRHPDHTAEAETQAILEFSGGKTALIDSSFILTHRADYEVSSSTGRIRAFNAYNPGLEKRLNVEINKGNVREQETLEGVNEYALEVDALVNSARQGKTPEITPEDSINNARVLEAINQSAETERWVDLS